MDNRVLVTLTDEELSYLEELAKKRNKKDEVIKQKELRPGMSTLSSHTIGLVGEMAVSKFYGINEVDEEIFDLHGDDGIDLEIPNMGNVQVKTTTYGTDPYLRIETHRPHSNIDNYVGVYVDINKPNEAWLLGWIEKSVAITKRKRKLCKYGPLNYIVYEKELHPCLKTSKTYMTKIYVDHPHIRNGFIELNIPSRNAKNEVKYLKDLYKSEVERLYGEELYCEILNKTYILSRRGVLIETI